jgi:hypothetical protein
MKRFLALAAMITLVLGVGLYADEGTLIDFTKLVSDVEGRTVVANGFDTSDGTPALNAHTVMDFRNNPKISSYTDEQREAMRTSLAISNWLVELASSAQSVTSNKLSYTKEVTSTQYGKLMGVRVRFPTEPYNSWALIKPPFNIPAYELSTTDAQGNITLSQDQTANLNNPSRFEDGYGVIKNVGAIKSVAVDVYGLNYPHSLYTIWADGNGNETEVFMGYLNFEGWAELRWENPAYIQEIRARTMRIYPIYPDYTPYIIFKGFRIKRDASHVGGDFVTYFRDVKIVYDKHTLNETRDINDEQEWQIITDREAADQKAEFENYSLDQIYRYAAEQEKATPNDYSTWKTDYTGGAQNGQAADGQAAGGGGQAAPAAGGAAPAAGGAAAPAAGGAAAPAAGGAAPAAPAAQ